ncbi:MAG: translocation/assembly module TamB domain-containing protein, partial [Polyangiales bacterium]
RDLRVVDLSAAGALDIGKDVRVRIDRAQGTLTQPFGYVAYIDALSGTISTASSEGIALRASVHRNQEQASATIRFAANAARPNGPQELGLEVQAQRVSAGTLQGLGYAWMPSLALPLSGRLGLHGAVAQLAVDAQLDTDAGHADVNGTISSSTGVSVTLQSRALDLAKLFPGYPRIRANGLLRVDSPRGAEQTRLHAEVEPLLYGTIAVPGLNFDATMEDTGLRIDRIDARSRGARISGRGHIDKSGAIALQMTAAFADIAADENLRRFMPDAHGRLTAELSVRTPSVGQAKLDFDGHLALDGFSYGAVSAKRLDLRGSAHGDPERPRLRVSVSGSEFRLGAYLLGDPSLRVQGGPHDYEAEGQFIAAGQRTLSVSAKIAAERDELTVDADTIELAVGKDVWRGALTGLRVVGDDRVELETLRLANRSQRLEAHGVVRFHGDDALDAQLQDFDLAALRALLGEKLVLERGHVDAHVQLAGDLSDPDLKLQGALRDGAAQGVTGMGVLYLVTYKQGRIEADGDVDLGPRGAFRVTGTGRIDPSLQDRLQALKLGNYELDLTGQDLALAQLRAVERAGVSGTLSGNLHFEGTLDRPVFSGSIELDSLAFGGLQNFSVAADGGYGNGELNARFSVSDEYGPLLTAGGETQLDWHALMNEPGTLSRTLLQGPWKVSGETAARSLQRLPKPAAQPYPMELTTHFELQRQGQSTSGDVRFGLEWQGAPLGGNCSAEIRPTVRGELTLDHGHSHIAFEMLAQTEQVAHFDVDLDTPVDRWLEQGRFEPPAALRASGHVQVQDIARLPYLCELGTGELKTELTLEDGLTDKPKLSLAGDARFSPRTEVAGRAALQSQSCEGDPIGVHFEVGGDCEAITGSATMQGCHGGATELKAEVPVRWNHLLVLPQARRDAPLTAQAHFDGSQLKPLLERVPGVLDASAVAYGTVEIGGTLAKLTTSGQLNVGNGHVYVVATGQRLSEISARLSFRDDWVKLEQLQAEAGKGRLEAVGGIGFVGPWPERMRIAVLATRFPIQREGVDTAWLTGSAVLDADVTTERARIAVDVQQLEVELPETSNRTLQALDPNPDVALRGVRPAPAHSAYAIELAIKGSRKLNVHRNDFDLGIAMELDVRYQDPGLNVGGYIGFNSGEFEIFGKRFTIGSGSLRFDGGSELNPDVLLVATQKTDVAGTSPVTVSVTGTLAEPEVTFASDVCPGESSAITYLISGQCAAEDTDLALESTDAQSAFTSGLVGGVLTLGAQHEISAFTPRIGVEHTTGGAERLKAGFSSESIVPKFMRKLVQRVYVEGAYTPGTGTETSATAEQAATTTTMQFLIELYFAHNIVGSGRFAPENWGVDMLWEP